LFESLLGALTKDKVLCRGFGRRKGQGWSFTSRTLNQSNGLGVLFSDRRDSADEESDALYAALTAFESGDATYKLPVPAH
jgi:hypothetical protein